ncbi:MAG: galactose-1-phosphate uridylyltransferase [Calditrichaceae bacterium]
MSELRKDPILGRWVIISKERGKRPIDFEIIAASVKSDYCPFCPGNEESTPPEIYKISGENNGWSLRVIPNKFPVLHVEGNLERKGEGIYDLLNGIGAHEVIIETNVHDEKMENYNQPHLENIIKTYRSRILDLKNDNRLKYAIIFKNHGADAGASLEHAHSQLVALPIVPQIINEELGGSKKYFDFKERCIFCDIIDQELVQQKRIVLENEYFIALEPYAARFPFETWILPKKHESNFEMLENSRIPNLANLLLNTLKKLKIALNDASYNLVIHSAPFADEFMPYYHWHIEIIPKVSQVAGFEWGTGFYINPTSPEEAAEFLQNITL